MAVNTYSKEFQLAVRRMKTCKTISGLAAELGVGRRFLYKWREQLRTEGEDALARRPGQPRNKEQLAASAKRARAVAKKKVQGPLQKRIAELERRLGAKTTGSRFFQAHLRACQGSDAESGKRRRGSVYGGIEASLSLEGKGLTFGRQCELAGVSRSGFYRYLQQEQPKEEDLLFHEPTASVKNNLSFLRSFVSPRL